MKFNLSIFRFRPVRYGAAALTLWGASELNLLPGCPEIERKTEPEVPTCTQTAQPNDGLEIMAGRCADVPPDLRDDIVQHELEERGCKERVSIGEPVTYEIDSFPQDEWCEVIIDRAT